MRVAYPIRGESKDQLYGLIVGHDIPDPVTGQDQERGLGDIMDPVQGPGHITPPRLP